MRISSSLIFWAFFASPLWPGLGAPNPPPEQGDAGKQDLPPGALARLGAAHHGTRSGTSSVAFSPDGRRVAGTGPDDTVLLWDAATGQELRRFAGHENTVNAVAFSPDGKLLASGSHDMTLRLWDA